MIFLPFFVDNPEENLERLYPPSMFRNVDRDRFKRPVEETNAKNDTELMGITAKLLEKLRPLCEEIFWDKCAYCERNIPTFEERVAYWRPAGYTQNPVTKIQEKGSYPWFQNEPRNVYYCCSSCAVSQNNQFPTQEALSDARNWAVAQREVPLLLAPYEDDPSKHLKFCADGAVEAQIDSETGEKSPRGEATIKVFGLNRADLVAERHQTLEQFRERLKDGGDTHWLNRWLDPSHRFAGALWQEYRRNVWSGSHSLAHVAALQRVTERENAITVAVGKLEKQSVSEAQRSPEVAKIAISRRYTPPPKTTSVKIESVLIRDFRGIHYLELKMPAPSEDVAITFDPTLRSLLKPHARSDDVASAPCLLLLGENGAGKTDVLQAIALALLTNHERESLALDSSKFVNQGKDKASVKITTDRGVFSLQITAKEGFQSTLPTGFEATTPPPLLLGYGTFRDVRPLNDARASEKPPTHPICNLFKNRDYLLDTEWWCEHDREILNIAARLIPHNAVKLKKEDGKPLVNLFATQGGADNLGIDQLCSGHRAIVSLVCDIIYKLQNLSGIPVTERKTTEGIVLIDELELHLHISWRQIILRRLRSEFPKVTFIICTQDAHLASSGREGEIRRLSRESASSPVKVKTISAQELMHQSMSEMLNTAAFRVNE